MALPEGLSAVLTSGVLLAASYSVADVDLGGAALPTTQTGSYADQDSFGVSVAVRF